MSLFLQYQLGQALGDLGGSGGGCAADSPMASGAATGFGLGVGFLMPALLMRAVPMPWRPMTHGWPGPRGFLGGHRFCGHCGAGLVPGGRFCGHCGTAAGR